MAKAKSNVKRMKPEEVEAWDALYAYVKYDVLKYEKKMNIPSYMVTRLKGMTEGKFIANNSRKELAEYSYELILTTFKICNPEIQRGLSSVEFKDEKHRFNYIMKIIDSNINDVYIRIKKAEEVKQDVRDQIETEEFVPTKQRPKYKREKKKKDRFAEFW